MFLHGIDARTKKAGYARGFYTVKVIGTKEGQVLVSHGYKLLLGPNLGHLLRTDVN